MQRVMREVERVAPLASTVWISGETGVGKGLVARALHQRSPRERRPFVHVDCAALAPSVLESELFGHERGAFTGAVARRVGRLERAADGTLFLDEIGELALALQARLLRVLQDREFERVGSSTPRRLRARIVVATQRDLRADVAAGRFRADLFYRLDVIRLAIPPLRARPEDLPPLVVTRLARIGARDGLAPPTLDDSALTALAGHHWPGNVRELENVLERLAAHHAGAAVGGAEVRAVLAPSAAARDRVCEGAPSGARRLAAWAEALEASGGNVAEAARALGVPRTTLRRHLARIGTRSAEPERRRAVHEHQPQRDGGEHDLVEPHEEGLAHTPEDRTAHRRARDDGNA